MNKIRQIFSPLMILLMGLLAGASVIGEWQNPWRWLFIFIFMMFGPGASFSYFYPGKDVITCLVLIVAVSLSLATAVTQALLYAGVWSARLAFFILLSISWCGLLLSVLFQTPGQKPRALLHELMLQPRLYLSRLWRNVWLILFAGLFLVNLSAIYSYYIAPPVYEAVAEFALSPKAGYASSDSHPSGLETATVAEYAARLTNPVVIESTFRLLDENIENYIKYKVSTSFQAETGKIQLRVRGPNPALTASLANSIGQNAVIQINHSHDEYQLEFAQKSSIPIAPSGPNFIFNSVVAFVLGLFLGSGLALFCDNTNDFTAKTT